MSEFNPALQFVLKHEGTTLYEDHQTGERSRYGITQKLLSGIRYPITDPNLLNNLDVEQIYRKTFWMPNKLDQFNSQAIANKLFDMSVNMGIVAIRLLQAALNMCGAQCVIDGIVGPHTIITVNQYCAINGNEEKLLGELVLQSVSYYKRISTNRPELAKNLTGWITRAEDTGLPQADKAAFNTLRDGSTDKEIKG